MMLWTLHEVIIFQEVSLWVVVLKQPLLDEAMIVVPLFIAETSESVLLALKVLIQFVLWRSVSTSEKALEIYVAIHRIER
jgi:hypothetical protein